MEINNHTCYLLLFLLPFRFEEERLVESSGITIPVQSFGGLDLKDSRLMPFPSCSLLNSSCVVIELQGPCGNRRSK